MHVFYSRIIKVDGLEKYIKVDFQETVCEKLTRCSSG